MAIQHQPAARSLAGDGNHVWSPAASILKLDADAGRLSQSVGNPLGYLGFAGGAGRQIRVDRIYPHQLRQGRRQAPASRDCHVRPFKHLRA
jgi:hypothetical protein